MKLRDAGCPRASGHKSFVTPIIPPTYAGSPLQRMIVVISPPGFKQLKISRKLST
jgi:hypothetical protein